MPFQTIPINISGPSYKDRSRPLSVQETRNFYQQAVKSGKEQQVIKSFPGQKLLNSQQVKSEDRGMHQMAEVAYRVLGEKLYSLTANGIHTELGDVPGSGRCIFDDDGIFLYIVTEQRKVYQYDSDAVSISQVTDTNIDGSKSVTFLNNTFCYTQDDITVFSDIGNGASASGLNAVGAESKPDGLVRDYAFNQILYRLGQRTVEQWYNSGVGSPPWDRVEGQFFNVGCAAIHSVTNTKNFLYWLGSDRKVYRARAGQDEAISTDAIAGAIQGYSDVSDAFGEVLTIDNLDVYVLTFPSADKTWALIEQYGQDGWFELSAGTGEGRYNAGSILDVYDQTMVGDYESGAVYKLSFGSYDQGGDTWQRRRVLGSINGDKIGQKGKRVKMSRFELILETGVGVLSGQGEDPQIMIEASYDGGRSWDQGTWMKIGRLGEYDVRAEWWSMKSFYDMTIRITTSDPVAYNIYSAAIDIKPAGR